MKHNLFIVFVLCALFSIQSLGQNNSNKVQNQQTGNANDEVLQRKTQFDFWIDEDPYLTKGNPEPTMILVNNLGYLTFDIHKDSNLTITILAEGKTISEVKNLMSEKLKEKFYRIATVHLKPLRGTEMQNAFVYFRTGRTQSVFPLSSGRAKKLSEAILELNLGEYANLKKVELKRMNPKTQRKKIYIINVKHIIDTGDTKNEDMTLQDGDIVTIKQKVFQF